MTSGFLVSSGMVLKNSCLALAGEERRIDLQLIEDRLVELGFREAGSADVEGAVAVAVEFADEGGEGDRLAATDRAGEEQDILVGDAEGEAGERLLMGGGGKRVGGLEVLAERQAGEAEEGEDVIMHLHRGAPWG